MQEETIGDRIRFLRKSEKLTQVQLADAMHCGYTIVSEWERNIKIPNVESVIKICQFFDVSSDYLLGLKEV